MMSSSWPLHTCYFSCCKTIVGSVERRSLKPIFAYTPDNQSPGELTVFSFGSIFSFHVAKENNFKIITLWNSR